MSINSGSEMSTLTQENYFGVKEVDESSSDDDSDTESKLTIK